MGALTSLLVLASLLASIEENLPKTSYFKKIDVWDRFYEARPDSFSNFRRFSAQKQPI
jgi:hypothetical protein